MARRLAIARACPWASVPLARPGRRYRTGTEPAVPRRSRRRTPGRSSPRSRSAATRRSPEEQDFDSLIEAEVGEPLTEERIRHTLRNLQASGTASETELYTRDDPERGGVVVMIVFRAVVQVSEVRVTGKLGLGADDLRRAISQAVAQPLSEETGAAGRQRAEGRSTSATATSRPEVRVAVETDPMHRRAIVTYRVDSGPRATVSTIAFDHPVAPFPAGRAGQAAPAPVRQAVQPAHRRRGRRAAPGLAHRQALRPGAGRRAGGGPGGGEQHCQAHLSDRDRPQDRARRQGSRREEAAPRGAPPLLRRVRLRRGPGAAGPEPHQDLVPAAGALRRAGRHRREADRRPSSCSPSPSPPARSTRSGRSSSRGTQEVPDAKLRPIMKTSEPSLLRRGSGRLVQSDLDADLENLRRYYALDRLHEGRGGPPQVERKGEDLRLVIPIKEGPRERVVKIDFQGVAALDLAAPCASACRSRRGSGFHPVLLDNTLDALRAANTPPRGIPRPRSPPARTGTRITPWWTSPSRRSKGRARWSTASSCAATSARRAT